MTTVVALGGNALARRGDPPDVEVQRRNVVRAAAAIAALAAGDDVVVTHGNGPQVGLLALQAVSPGASPVPLDVLDAETEGMIGYLLEEALGRCRRPDDIAALLTQVVVDPDDPAFASPTKPIGPVYDAPEGARLARERGWAFAAVEGGVRRVVPSPEPLAVVELNAIRVLLRAGMLVIAAGGGGIPVVACSTGGHRGVEAVVDKDLTSALLAAELEADRLLLLTDVDGVYLDHGTAEAARIRRAGAPQLRALRLPAGSMGPKVEAACRFAERGGEARIGALDDLEALLAGRSGTEVVAGSHAVERARLEP